MDFLTRAKERISLVALVVIFALPSAIFAQLSPGDLSRPHEGLEGISNCTACHELGEGPSADKCLDCHQLIKQQVEQKRGYHNRLINIEGKSCFECHNEHAGRDFELIHWDQNSFDHSQTEYKLEGKHATLPCRDCHNPALIKSDLTSVEKEKDLTRSFMGLKTDCLECHRDEHRGQLGTDCRNCHNQEKFKPATGFSHDKAKFVLTGKHAVADCAKCHKPIEDSSVPAGTNVTYAHYKPISSANCTDCHKDVHLGKFGSDCSRCHSTLGWKQVAADKFNHDSTAFPLTGLHLKVPCDKCHKGGNLTGRLPHSQCTDCHKDVHLGRLGNDCAGCHRTSGWKQIAADKFNHDITAFPLIGLHQKVPCEKCHKGGTTTGRLPHGQCIDCHNDIHRGQFAERVDKGACNACHNEQGFMPARFTVADHDQTKFKLVGAHLAQPCVVCHKMAVGADGTEYRNFDIEHSSCLSCHQDRHAGQFTSSDPVKNCTVCHGQSSWHELVFVHNRDSRYQLVGAHQKVACLGCHKEEEIGDVVTIRYRPLAQKCNDCHQSNKELREL